LPRSEKAPRGAGSEPQEIAPAIKPKAKADAKPDTKPAVATPSVAEKSGQSGDPKVISIDAFRKKT
jgi:hypothetical protein